MAIGGHCHPIKSLDPLTPPTTEPINNMLKIVTVNGASLLQELTDSTSLTRKCLKTEKAGDRKLPIQLSCSSCYQLMKTKGKYTQF